MNKNHITKHPPSFHNSTSLPIQNTLIDHHQRHHHIHGHWPIYITKILPFHNVFNKNQSLRLCHHYHIYMIVVHTTIVVIFINKITKTPSLSSSSSILPPKIVPSQTPSSFFFDIILLLHHHNFPVQGIYYV